MVDKLLAGLAKAGTPLTREQLQEIVQTNDKQRYAFSDNGQSIRASQGHSVGNIDLQLRQKTPPSHLFHGIVCANVTSIKKKGLLPMKRHHVHLSPDVKTATGVGSRRGIPVIFEVSALAMTSDGCQFWLSENGVWLE